MAKKIDLRIEGMMCSHCVATVENKLRELGCTDICVNLSGGSASLSAPDGISGEDIAAAIDALGFAARLG